MSLRLRWGTAPPLLLAILPLLMTVLNPRPASAEEPKPAFYDVEEDPSVRSPGTALSGSVTSSTFFFSESAASSGGDVPIENASATDRVFTDLRLKLDAKHVGGGHLDVAFDFQGRKQIERCKTRPADGDNPGRCEAAQSGLLGGDELYLRLARLRYRGAKSEVSVGRLVATEVAATKFDGLKVERHISAAWKALAFAGAYPLRGSRSLQSDYEKVPKNPTDPASAKKRLVPLVAGAGLNYGGESVHGTLGFGAIVPRGKTMTEGASEKSRVFLSTSGFWKKSNKTDFYHYVVVDLAGVRGPAITNLSLGAVHHPSSGTRFFVRLDRVDTETLAVHAQERLSEIDSMASAPIQNNWYVARVAQESGEVGASGAFKKNRFSVTASGTLRRRPKLALLQTSRTIVSLARAQALDIKVALVDRKSLMGFRAGATVVRSLGVGKASLDRSKSTLAALKLSRDLAGGQGEFEINLSYLRSNDQTSAADCGPGQVDFERCYGASDSTSMAAGGVVFYRPKTNWYTMALLNVTRQSLAASEGGQGARVAQPALLMVSAYIRLAYRF